MDYHLNVAHTLAEGEDEASLIDEHFIDAGLIEIKKASRPDVTYEPRELEVTLIGEPHVLLDWMLNHWHGPSTATGSPARFELVLECLKSAEPGRK